MNKTALILAADANRIAAAQREVQRKEQQALRDILSAITQYDQDNASLLTMRVWFQLLTRIESVAKAAL